MEFYIILAIIALICIAGSFVITEKVDSRLSSGEIGLTEEMFTSLLEHNKDIIRSSAMESAEKVKNETIEGTLKELNRISNEKIMAVDEFSDTVLEKINQNHSEVIFLYNMLCEKEKELKELMISGKNKNENVVKFNNDSRKNESTGRSKSVQEKEVTRMPKKDKEKGANQRAEILEAHKKGESVVEIARRLNVGQGEVKLIIDLYQGAKE